jgi:hypothetical protein
MAKHLDDKTGRLKARQKRSEVLAAIFWIQLKVTDVCSKGSKTTVFKSSVDRFAGDDSWKSVITSFSVQETKC